MREADETAIGADPESAGGGEMEGVDGGAGKAVVACVGAEVGAGEVVETAAVGADPEGPIGGNGLAEDDGGDAAEIVEWLGGSEAETVEESEAG